MIDARRAGLALLLSAAACRCQQREPVASTEWLEGHLPAASVATSTADGGTLTIRLSVEPAGLTRLHDRLNEAGMARFTVGPLLETLATRAVDDPSRLEPLLAAGWEWSGDALVLTLKPDVTFHDGTPFGPGDVKATFDAILDAAHPTAAARSSLDGLGRVDVLDERRVRLQFERRSASAERSALLGIPMHAAHDLEGDFDTLGLHQHPNGTGPFRFISWKHGEAITLARNDRYHGARARLDLVVLRFVKDDTVAQQLWEQGAFDVMTRIPPATWRAIEHQAWAIRGYARHRTLDDAYSWVGWNERRAVFADPRVRRALALLYPAEVVASQVELGLEPRTTCPYYRSATACDPAITPLPHDPAAAARLLDEAGWADHDGDGVRDRDGVPLAFTVLASSASAKFTKLLPLFQDALRPAGVAMSIERVDASAYVARLAAHDFDAGTLSWSSPSDAMDLFQIFHSSQAAAGSNYVGYANDDVDRWLAQIRHTADESARGALERQVHAKLFEDQVYLFLTLRPQLDALKRRVHGVRWRNGWYELGHLQVGD